MAAADGQTLDQQSDQTKSDFQATYGNNAQQAWEQQHNADIGANQPAAPSPQQPQRTQQVQDQAPAPAQGTSSADIAKAIQQAMAGGNQRADAQITSLMQALSATNEQDFQQRVSEFNQTHALALQEFGLKQQAEAFDQQMRTATATGMFNGQPTEAARQFNVASGEKQREFNVTTQRDLADLSSKLTGPADYFKFLNATNQGRDIIGSLTGDKPRPAFGGFQGNAQPQTLDTIFQRLGIGGGSSSFADQGKPTPAAPGPGSGTERMLGGPGAGQPPATGFGAAGSGSPGGESSPGAGTQTRQGMIALPNNMGFIPLPHLVNPAVWDSWGKSGQEFIKGAASAAGLDPNWYESTVNATRPGTGTYGPATQSAYSSGGQSNY